MYAYLICAADLRYNRFSGECGLYLLYLFRGNQESLVVVVAPADHLDGGLCVCSVLTLILVDDMTALVPDDHIKGVLAIGLPRTRHADLSPERGGTGLRSQIERIDMVLFRQEPIQIPLLVDSAALGGDNTGHLCVCLGQSGV